MKLKKIYEIIVQEGINADPRSKSVIQEGLEKLKKYYESLPIEEKECFDKEELTNPYADTRVLNGDPNLDIQTILVGIDIDTSELLLIDRLNSCAKRKVDLALSHHPQGQAYASYYKVMDMQSDIFHDLGIPINLTERLVAQRKGEVGRKVHAANHQRATDAARLLGVPLMCAHTAADNHAYEFLQKAIEKEVPQKLKHIMELLSSIEEYKIASRQQAGPRILFGKPDDSAGKIFVDMTGGTEGPKEIIENLLQAGIGTFLGMHISEEHYKKFKENNISVIVAGHIASDNIGMNLLLDKIEKQERINIREFSGFKRIKR